MLWDLLQDPDSIPAERKREAFRTLAQALLRSVRDKVANVFHTTLEVGLVIDKGFTKRSSAMCKLDYATIRQQKYQCPQEALAAQLLGLQGLLGRQSMLRRVACNIGRVHLSEFFI